MINTYTSTVPPPPPPRSPLPSSMMKTFVWFLFFLILVQMIVFSLFFTHQWKKNDMIQSSLNEHSDLTVIKRLLQCGIEEDVTSSLLDCKKILGEFQKKVFPNEMKPKMLRGTPEDPHSPPIAAHLRIGAPCSGKQQIETCLTKNTITDWITDPNLDMTTNLFYETSSGNLVIREAGLYYIYSQVTFSSMRQQNSFSQYVMLKDSTEKNVLLLRAISSSTEGTESKLHTLFQGGVFTLKRNDRVFVNVSDIRRVHFNGTATLFGLFRL
ncbi:CD40 ligand [Polypterus senegalus]|uniref:CD40 ligand n=1 Tax=Polypterus senegalus TaxID=55291 RepID=UPI001964CF72|nr:CD40 ligand [Polypterus senegalus]